MIPHCTAGESLLARVDPTAGRLPVKAGLSRDVRFHDLRHTAATLLLASGVNVKVVSEMLGHSNVAITLRIYAHVLPHMQQSAVQAMDALLGTPAESYGPKYLASESGKHEGSETDIAGPR